jgi:hypothetical protein
MARPGPHRRIVPVVLGLAMLAVVVAAALVPNNSLIPGAGVVQAQTNGPYNQNASSTVSPWVYLGGAAAAIVLGLLLALFLMRRRRRPPTAAPPPVQAWQGGGAPPPSGGAGGPPAAAPAYL